MWVNELYILQELKDILQNLTIWLYRDDELIVIEKKLSNVELEKNKKCTSLLKA